MRISDSRNSTLRIMPNNASNAAKGWEKPRGACSSIEPGVVKVTTLKYTAWPNWN